MDLKTRMIERVCQLAQKQAEMKEYCHRVFGGFGGEVFVPASLESLSDAELLEMFEQLVSAKAAREASSQ